MSGRRSRRRPHTRLHHLKETVAGGSDGEVADYCRVEIKNV
jgi:hypothetical protein